MSAVVIKAGASRLIGRGLYSLDLRDIAGKAEEMLTSAREEAVRTASEARQQARLEAESLRQEARRSGYQEGFMEGRAAGAEQGLEEARRRLAEEQALLVTTLRTLMETFSEQREKLYLAARRDVVVLAIEIARRLADRIPELPGAATRAAESVCAEALELLSGTTEVVIQTNPADRAALEHLAESLHATLSSSRHLRVVPDETVKRGGVVVRTADSLIDGRLRERLERIADELVTDWRQRMKELALADK